MGMTSQHGADYGIRYRGWVAGYKTGRWRPVIGWALDLGDDAALDGLRDESNGRVAIPGEGA